MSKHTVKGFITYEKNPWSDKPQINFMEWRPSAEYWPNRVVVREHSVEVDVPDDFNPTPLQVAALEEQKKALRLKLANELREIDDRISKLTCIEHTPAVA